MTTKGRKPLAAAIVEVIDPALDQNKIDGAMVAMRKQAQDDESALAAASQLVGGALMARLHTQFSAAAEVRMFEQIRALPNGVIKKIPIQRPDGTSATAGTLVEFCPLVFGRPYNTMDEAARNLAALGDATYEVASTLGLNRSALRAARALPPEKLEAVRLAIANGTTRADVMSVIEDLALKAEEAQAEVTEAQAELVARDQLLADKNKRIDQLKAAQKRIAKAPADEQLAELQKEATAIMHDAQGALRGGVRHALIALQNHDEDNGTFMAGLVGQLQADLNALRDEFSLPDISNAEALQVAADMAQWDKS